MRIFRLLAATMVMALTCGLSSIAQMAKPVKMNATFNKISETEGEIVFEASIDPGWHMYSTNVVEDGPNPTVIHFDNLKGAKANGPLKPVTKPIQQFDPIFEAELFFFEKSAKLVQKVTFTGGPYEVEGYIEYSACNDQNCTPPTTTEFKYNGEAKGAVKEDAKDAKKDEKKNEANADEKAAEEPVAATPTLATTTDSTTQDSAVVIPTAASDYWTPVIDQLKAFENGGKNDVGHSSLWMIFLLGLLGGLVALVTPCVWPIIPMTVSFFLHRSGDKKKGVKDAVVYGISIVIIYVALGLIVTWIFGASALNNMATNAVFNIFFFLLLVVFAASFFGAFEITLPSSWSSAVDSKAEKTGGLLGIFLMAFTLTLVSFSCTGPIIGFLLVEVSTMGSIIAPTIGMLGFAVALALPFTLFAMFPSWLKSAPKSGGWMNVVKVTLGFIELAFALKFLSVADLTQGWRILDRETFLALWIVIFGLLGVYLLGGIKFPHDDDDRHIGVFRFFLAMASLAFAVYMVPGLWGAPLKAVSAFAPPMKTQDFNLYDNEVKPKFTDYDAGMEYARQHAQPVMIDFTGYGCVNCRKMEAAVWVDPTVASIMNNDYVLIQLYVDERTPLAEPLVVNENGQERKLRTVGDKWSYLQSSKFGANAQPFYVLLDNQGNPLAPSYSYDEDVSKYVDFLRGGLNKYKNVE